MPYHPPYDCVCGKKFPTEKMFIRHIFRERYIADKAGVKSTHRKANPMGWNERSERSAESRRRRYEARMKFLNGE